MEKIAVQMECPRTNANSIVDSIHCSMVGTRQDSVAETAKGLGIGWDSVERSKEVIMCVLRRVLISGSSRDDEEATHGEHLPPRGDCRDGAFACAMRRETVCGSGTAAIESCLSSWRWRPMEEKRGESSTLRSRSRNVCV